MEIADLAASKFKWIFRNGLSKKIASFSTLLRRGGGSTFSFSLQERLQISTIFELVLLFSVVLAKHRCNFHLWLVVSNYCCCFSYCLFSSFYAVAAHSYGYVLVRTTATDTQTGACASIHKLLRSKWGNVFMIHLRMQPQALNVFKMFVCVIPLTFVSPSLSKELIAKSKRFLILSSSSICSYNNPIESAL